MVKRNLATSELCRGKEVCRVQSGMAPFARVTTSEKTAIHRHRRKTGPRGKWARLSTCTRREGIQVDSGLVVLEQNRESHPIHDVHERGKQAFGILHVLWPLATGPFGGQAQAVPLTSC